MEYNSLARENVVMLQHAAANLTIHRPLVQPLAISLVSSGRIDLKPLVTHRFQFRDAVEAFNATKNGKGTDGRGIIKVCYPCTPSISQRSQDGKLTQPFSTISHRPCSGI